MISKNKIEYRTILFFLIIQPLFPCLLCTTNFLIANVYFMEVGVMVNMQHWQYEAKGPEEG